MQLRISNRRSMAFVVIAPLLVYRVIWTLGVCNIPSVLSRFIRRSMNFVCHRVVPRIIRTLGVFNFSFVLSRFFVGQAFFSTPALYTRAKHASELEWSIKKDDFFPYADCPVRKNKNKNVCSFFTKKTLVFLFIFKNMLFYWVQVK